MISNKNLIDIETDIYLAQSIFGVSNVRTSDNKKDWIMIKDYKLPKGYNQIYSNFLVIIPSGYGYGKHLEEFYLDKGLKIKQNGKYVALPHYYERNILKGVSYFDKNWQWLCIHPEWNKGDNISTFIKQVELFLTYPFNSSML